MGWVGWEGGDAHGGFDKLTNTPLELHDISKMFDGEIYLFYTPPRIDYEPSLIINNHIDLQVNICNALF